jgi:hypothetical protein
MVTHLPFESLEEPVERVLDVRGFRVCPERLPGDEQRSLQPTMALGPVPLGDDLDLHALHAGLEAIESL